MAEVSEELVGAVHNALNQLASNPFPTVPTPKGCKRRASVAVVIRVRPAFRPLPAAKDSLVDIVEQDATSPNTLDDFFAQQWVKQGDPEVLFIKRAGRASDRWSGHIALPGGRRDPEDEGDLAAAIRETREEVGLDLATEDCLEAGNLPQRVVATTFGKEPLMVLCPYIFVCTSKNVPRVSPQPTEVASAHWVPIRALLSPAQRTREYVDTASRMAKQGGPVAQWLLRMTVGKMVFSAIRLAPSESIWASSIPDFLPKTGETHLESILEGALGMTPRSKQRGLTHQQDLLLWGLTLGVLADFLDMLPPYNAVQLWRYPTFTVPDLRLLVWLLTRGLRHNNAGDLSAGTWPSGRAAASQTAVDSETAAIAVTEAEPNKLVEARRKRDADKTVSGGGQESRDAVSRLLVGYYERINIAVAGFVVYRTVLGSAAAYGLYKLWLKRGGAR